MGPGPRARRWVLDAWPLLLAVVLTLPLLRQPGHPLARDLVFVPHQPWTDAVLGLGDTPPRAVPLDAVVSVLTGHLLDGGLVARVAIPLILAAAGWGAHRLVGGLGTPARLAAGGLAVWNPYVVERLALGQWALLGAYAALPWLLAAARRFRLGGRAADAGATAGWLGLASLTPTGGLIGSAAVLTAGWSRSLRRTAVLLAGCLVLQLPWLVPSLLASSAFGSDPRSVEAFSADADGPGGVLVALLGLGGIWDRGSVPVTRGAWWGPVTAAVVVVALVVGWTTLRRIWGRGDLVRVAALATAGLLLALLSSLPIGVDVVGWVVSHVPGGGLLRDSQKLLAPWVVLAVAAVAAAVDRGARAAAAAGSEVVGSVGVAAVLLPLVLLPDGARTAWPTLEPVTYPPGLAASAELVGSDRGTLVTLPWRSYRRFSWGNGLTSSDPAVRWFDTDVLTSDDLQVGPVLLRGEGARAAALGRALETEPTAQALRAAGVTWALVYRDDPAAADLDLAGLDLAYRDDLLALYRVPGVSARVEASWPERVAAVAAFAVAAAVSLAGAAVATSSRLRANRRRGATLGDDERENS
ncbi:hypothetical protein [Nocardioides sp.]|uniref:hypothetical protein n=1 Tax=Nocardioides sp. TaxID=35761 RepID=UPI003783B170